MRRIFSLLALTTFSTLAFANRTLTVSVTNPSNVERTDVPVVLSLASYGEVRSALVTLSGKEVPCQLDDLNQDDSFRKVAMVATRPSAASMTLSSASRPPVPITRSRAISGTAWAKASCVTGSPAGSSTRSPTSCAAAAATFF